MAARLPRSNAIIIKATSDRHEPTVPHLSCPVNDLRGVTGGTPRQRVSLALAAIASPVESGQSTDVGSSAEVSKTLFVVWGKGKGKEQHFLGQATCWVYSTKMLIDSMHVQARRICKQTPRVPMQPPPLSTAAQPTNGPSASAAAAAAAARPMEAESKAAVRPPDMAEAVIDLSSYDWLAFPYWAKVGCRGWVGLGYICACTVQFRSPNVHLRIRTQALELNNFPKFLLYVDLGLDSFNRGLVHQIDTIHLQTRWLTEQDAMLAGTVAMRQEEFELVFSKVLNRPVSLLVFDRSVEL